MTVRELIDKLQQYPDDHEVLLDYPSVGDVELGEVEDFDRIYDAILLKPERDADGSFYVMMFNETERGWDFMKVKPPSEPLMLTDR